MLYTTQPELVGLLDRMAESLDLWVPSSATDRKLLEEWDNLKSRLPEAPKMELVYNKEGIIRGFIISPATGEALTVEKLFGE